MWYDRSRMSTLFFIGAALVLVGLGLYLMDHGTAGMLLVCVGIAIVVIAFSVLRLHGAVMLRSSRKRP